MSDALSLLEFVYLPSFDRAVKGILNDAAVHALEETLLVDPEVGDRMTGTGGVRKMRFALGGRGKSSGLRVVYYYRTNRGRIYMLTAFAKTDQANLTTAQKHTMQQLVAAIERET